MASTLPVNDIVTRPGRRTAEVIGRATITRVVDVFYDRVRQHPTLAGPFRIINDWPAHKEKMAHFWWISLGGQPYMDYRYAVMPKHGAAGATPALVADWLKLFGEVVRVHVAPEQADIWLFRASRMGQSIGLVGEYYRRKRERQSDPRLTTCSDF